MRSSIGCFFPSPCRRVESFSFARLLTDPAGPLFGTERPRRARRASCGRRCDALDGRSPEGAEVTQTDHERTREAPPANGLDVMKRAIVGTPMPSDAMEETLLRKTLALPIFASDPFSSVAYATESAMVVLVATSLAATRLVFPLSIAISVLLVIVIASYRQTVRAYSTSGGSYVVSKENLGRIPSLVAAAALLVDYVLTVAVSVAAGILAITSAVPSLSGWIVELSIAAVVLITVVNLRGVRESGIAFAIPTYLFILAYLVMMGAGIGKCALTTCPVATTPDAIPAGAGAVTFFVLLRAFASGSAALTGIEAISNGVSAFRHPQARNAARTLVDPRRDRRHVLRRRVVARRADGGEAEHEHVRRLPDRAGDVPGRDGVRIHVLGRAGDDVRDPRSRREHLVPGLPAPRGAARPRPLLPASVREPG